MAITSRQIGWSQESNILWSISKQLEQIARLGGGGSGTVTGTGVNGQLAFWNGTTSVAGSNALSWDDVNKGLTISGSKYNVGTYWKAIPGSNFPVGNFRGITYGNGLFVAIAQRSANPDSTTTSIVTSPDGVTWTFRTLPTITSLIGVTYQNGIFIAYGHLSQRGFYSYDGINWFITTGLNGQIYGMTYGRDKFVACKIDNSLGRIAISYDGKNWQNVVTPASMDLAFTGIAYGNDRYVAVAGSTSANAIAISYDGITWTSVTRPLVGTVSPSSVTYGKGLFVVSCDNGKILTSPDGINWTARDTPLTGVLIWKCIYAEGVFIAAGAFISAQNRFIYSVDGITWLEANTPALNNWAGFAYGNGMVVAVSYGGPNTSALVAKSGELNNFIPQNDNITHGRQSFTDDVALIQSSRLGIGTNAPLASLVVASGNTLLGQNTDGGQRLQVNGTTLLKGSTSDATANALSVTNSSNTSLFSVANNGAATFNGNVTLAGSISSTSFGGVIQAGSLFSFYSSTGTIEAVLGITLNSASSASNGIGISRSTNITTNAANFLTINSSSIAFAPTSGSNEMNGILVAPIINQGGTANGITRGIYVNATLTSAANFRAIETARGNIVFSNLPTSSAGLPTGALWNNGGVVNIV